MKENNLEIKLRYLELLLEINDAGFDIEPILQSALYSMSNELGLAIMVEDKGINVKAWL